MKDSYKFFYASLSEDLKNIYATNGLGMICAEKGILQVSKDIFTRAREECLGTDVSINLAHVHLALKRFTDGSMNINRYYFVYHAIIIFLLLFVTS